MALSMAGDPGNAWRPKVFRTIRPSLLQQKLLWTGPEELDLNLVGQGSCSRSALGRGWLRRALVLRLPLLFAREGLALLAMSRALLTAAGRVAVEPALWSLRSGF
jgi:hypothetical protein